MNIKFTCLSLFGTLLLAGCSSQYGNAPIYDNSGKLSDEGSAATYGANDSGSYQESQHSAGFEADSRHYPVKAGENQIYYFGFDRDSIPSAAQKALKAQADYMLNHPSSHIRLEGNTDDRGSREYNMALGWRRADAVARYLEQLGVPRSQISEVSYGVERPVAFEHNEAAWRLNRRVRLVYETR